MAITISLSGLNGDWQVNNQSGINRVWTRGIYSIVYSENMFGTSNAGWIVKITDGVEIFGIKTDSGEVWDDDAEIIWNPNATGYDDDTTANLAISVIEEANPIDINPAYYKCNSVTETVWTGYKMKWDKNNGWINQESLTNNLTISGFTPEKDKVYNVNTTSLIYLYPDMPKVEIIKTTATDGDILYGKTAVLNGELITGTMSEFIETEIGIEGSTSVQLDAGYYEDVTVAVWDDNLKGANIKEGVTICGVVGEFKGGVELPTGITVTSADVKDGIFYIDSDGAKQEGTMPVRGSKTVTLSTSAQTLPAGYYESVTIPGSVFANLTAAQIEQATSDDSRVLEGETFITGLGTVIPGTMPNKGTIEVTLTDSVQEFTAGYYGGITVPAIPSDSGTVMEFYECASVKSSATGVTGIKVSGTVEGLESTYTNYDGNYILEDTDSTGASRKFINEGVGKIIYDEFAQGLYVWGLIGDDDDYWTDVFPSNNKNENASLAEICNSVWSSNRYYPNGDAYKFEEISESSNGAIWSGYKMTWIEGAPVKTAVGITVKFTSHDVGANGEYRFVDPSATGGERVLTMTNSNGEWNIIWSDDRWDIIDVTGDYFGPGMALYYTITELTEQATLEDLCNADWEFNIMGEMASGAHTVLYEESAGDSGWVKSDTPTEGLSIVGFTPSLGSVYNEDTTALVYLHPDQPTAEVIKTTATAGDILSGKTAVLNGILVTGTLSINNPDLSNLTAENIKYGETINGVQGTFSEEKYYPAEASCILSPFRAFVNGEYIQGTISELGVSAPYDGYYPQATDLIIPSAGKYCTENIVISGDANFKAENIKDGVNIWGVDGTYKGESSGGSSMEFYECASVNSGESYTGNIIVSGFNDDILNGKYTPTSGGWTQTKEGTTLYIKILDGSWALFEGYSGDEMVHASAYNNDDPNATAQEVCADQWTKGTFMAEVDNSGSTGTLTWSGYKMAWSEGDGWVRADGEPIDGLEIKGYTPESGKVYSADSTINGNMYPAEISAGGESSGGGMEFYKCASYTPKADAYTKYSFTLSGAPDEQANGTYIRTKWVENIDPDTEVATMAVWTNENGYKLQEEYEWGTLLYYVFSNTGDYLYNINGTGSVRLTDYNNDQWWDWNMGALVALTFTPWQTEEIPATTEGWTGYKVTQNTETGVWVASDVLTSDLTVTHLTPKVGEIFSADTSIRVHKMYDGAVYPIPSDGLVFYAPLQYDYVDAISKQTAVYTNGDFTTHNGLQCLQLDGSGGIKFPANSDLALGTSPLSMVIFIAPTNHYDWRTYLRIKGNNDGEDVVIHAKNGDTMEWTGSTYITADGMWQSIVITRDGNRDGKSYINGKFNATNDTWHGSGDNNGVQRPLSSPAQVYVGENIVGYIAFAAVYNRELTTEEIAEIHNTFMEDVKQ